MTTKQRAIGEAESITNELWRKTGKSYQVKAFSVGKIKYVDIRNDDRLVKHYRALTWVEMVRILHAAYDTYLTILNEN